MELVHLLNNPVLEFMFNLDKDPFRKYILAANVYTLLYNRDLVSFKVCQTISLHQGHTVLV